MATPPQGSFEGRGKGWLGLRNAMKEAHQKAAEAGMSGQWLEVKSIRVKGDNPIREYTVVLGPGG